jgi:hypothetical protein
MKHRCPVNGCKALVPSSKLMCPTHWFLVPAELGNAVYREYRRAPRTEAHFAAMQAAVDHVNNLKEAA